MLAYVFGILGIAANVLIYQQKTGKTLLLCKLISDVLWAVHYILLGAHTAAAIAVIGFCRELVFLRTWKSKRVYEAWLVCFLLCSVCSAAVTWNGWISILPAAASVLAVIGFWKKTPKLSRVLAYPISVCMLSYDIPFASWTGIINEILTLVSTTLGLLRYSEKRNGEKNGVK